MAKKNRTRLDGLIDCACVIHGTGYDWSYVDRLYNMLMRALSGQINFHVFTEASRHVPAHMIRHNLVDWGIQGPRRSWWYKLQMFNPEHHSGSFLYLDLDVVIARDLEWVRDLDLDYFWAIRDFRYLQRIKSTTLNSSMMWWNVPDYQYVWDEFTKLDLDNAVRRWPGDQDYLTHIIPYENRRFFEDKLFESYRWQCLDGGYDFEHRRSRRPGAGVGIAADTSVIVFHGNPKPHECSDPSIVQLWV